MLCYATAWLLAGIARALVDKSVFAYGKSWNCHLTLLHYFQFGAYNESLILWLLIYELDNSKPLHCYSVYFKSAVSYLKLYVKH
jgi:hypothetical protein